VTTSRTVAILPDHVTLVLNFLLPHKQSLQYSIFTTTHDSKNYDKVITNTCFGNNNNTANHGE